MEALLLTFGAFALLALLLDISKTLANIHLELHELRTGSPFRQPPKDTP